MMPKKISVTLVPTPRENGCFSMDRYWMAIDYLNRIKSPRNIYISTISPPENQTKRSHRLLKYFSKYIKYPILVRLRDPKPRIFHLLDHSHANLLKWIPHKSKKIVTVHDIAPLIFPENLTSSQIKRFRKIVLQLKNADILITDSVYTAKDIENFFGDECPPLRVNPLGVEFSKFSAQQEQKIALPQSPDVEPTILCVGSNLKRKNYEILPIVLAEVVRQIGHVRLIRVGPRLPAHIHKSLTAISNLKLSEVVNIDDNELVRLYQNSTLFFFPSFYEGFGLPILEAMAAGVPVVSSNATSLPEVGGNAVLYFSPDDPAMAANQMMRVVNDEKLRSDMIKNGIERAKTMSWENHFDNLLKIYREVAEW